MLMKDYSSILDTVLLTMKHINQKQYSIFKDSINTTFTTFMHHMWCRHILGFDLVFLFVMIWEVLMFAFFPSVRCEDRRAAMTNG